jgi:hypothetical protein
MSSNSRLRANIAEAQAISIPALIAVSRPIAKSDSGSGMINNLWSVARYKYTEDREPQIFLLDRPRTERVPRPDGVIIRTVRRRLIYKSETGSVWELELEWTGDSGQ